MNSKDINRLILENSKERLSGSEKEHAFARVLREECEKMGLSPQQECFEVTMYRVKEESLRIDGKPIFCKSYYGCKSGVVSADFYYLPLADERSLKQCAGKIVLIDPLLSEETYLKIVSAGAVGIITHGGSVEYACKLLRRGEIRFASFLPEEQKIPVVQIGAEDFVKIVSDGAKRAEITVLQEAFEGQSPNLILDLPGETEEMIVFAAHIDSTEDSLGAYDNLSGSLGLLLIAEEMMKKKHRRTVRFLWCGSEERGLLGSYAYCRMHPQDRERTVLNITLDMIGSVTGAFCSVACANRESQSVMEKFARKKRFSSEFRLSLRSTDVRPFVSEGIPAVSFARYTPKGIAPIHTVYDTPEAISAFSVKRDSRYIAAFASYLADAKEFPIPREIDPKLKEEADQYKARLFRER